MTPDPEISLPPRKSGYSRVRATLKALVRARITAGLLVVLPLWLTFLLVRFIFSAMRDASLWAVMGVLENPWIQMHVTRLAIKRGTTFDVDAFLQAHPYLDWGLAIIAVLLTILFLYVIGLFTANVIGRRIIEWFELLLDKLPLVKTVYRSSKQILTTFTGTEVQNFQRVALFPFLTQGVYSLGFVTSVFKDAVTGEEFATLFYATTPNPTTGFVFILKRSDLVELDWSIETAVKTIMSGGILLPPDFTVPLSIRGRAPAMPGLGSPGAAIPQAPRP